MNQPRRYKIFLSVMIFAFLWVIIGDLVNMHVRVFTGKDLYGHHQPFAKAHKHDKNVFKVKTQKSSNNVNKIDSSKFLSKTLQATFIRNTKDFLYWFVPKLIAENNSSSSQGRAPPC